MNHNSPALWKRCPEAISWFSLLTATLNWYFSPGRRSSGNFQLLTGPTMKVVVVSWETFVAVMATDVGCSLAWCPGMFHLSSISRLEGHFFVRNSRRTSVFSGAFFGCFLTGFFVCVTVFWKKISGLQVESSHETAVVRKTCSRLWEVCVQGGIQFCLLRPNHDTSTIETHRHQSQVRKGRIGFPLVQEWRFTTPVNQRGRSDHPRCVQRFQTSVNALLSLVDNLDLKLFRQSPEAIVEPSRIKSFHWKRSFDRWSYRRCSHLPSPSWIWGFYPSEVQSLHWNWYFRLPHKVESTPLAG